MNHLSKLCKGKPQSSKHRQVRHVDDEQSENSESDDSSDDLQHAFTILFSSEHNCYHDRVSQPIKSTKTFLKINDVNTQVIIDSGSTVNLIDKNSFNQIQKNTKAIQLQKSRKKIFPYGISKPLDIIGCFTATIESTERIVTAEIYVINQQSAGNLIGASTASS